MGIFKRKTPIITAVTNKKLCSEIRKKARDLNSKVFFLGKDFFVESNENNVFNFQNKRMNLKNLYLANKGRYQIYNAGLALHAISVLSDLKQFRIKTDSIKNALKTLCWPARLEFIPSNKNYTGSNILLDVAIILL